MLKEQDKIFKNLYGFEDWNLEGAKKRGIWSNTKELIKMGSEKLSQVAKEFCETNIGETSDDKKFTVVEVECLGACCNAPMVQINDDYYEDLDEESFKKLLQDLKDNKPIKVGSQIGRKSSQPERKFDA